MIAGNARPVVHFAEPLTSENCINLIDRIRSLRDDYFFSEVQLRLSSPGGEASALQYFLGESRELCASGFRIDTHAVTRVASAAAIMLSLGDVRTAHPKALLLYHTGRLPGVDGALTARGAASIANILGEVDGEIIGLLAERAAQSPPPSGDTPMERFAAGDWTIIGKLAPGNAKRPATAVRQFRKRVASAFAGGTKKLHALYEDFCALDVPVTPCMAQELGLIDSVGDGEPEAGERAADPGLTIPQWEALWPGGRVPRSALTRHTLVLGESGSGKTASGILPVLSAIVRDSAPVSCALVIDPKCELLSIVERMAGPGVQVRLLQPGVDSLNLMSGPRSVADDVAAGRWMTAARKMLARSAGFTQSAARVLAGKAASSPRMAFWENGGSRLASSALALSLMISQEDQFAKLLAATPSNSPERHQLVSFGRFAGMVDGRKGAPPGSALAVGARVLDSYFTNPSYAKLMIDLLDEEDDNEELAELRREVNYQAESKGAEGQFFGMLGEARLCFCPFADPAPARSLFFGVEGVTPTVDFTTAVDAQGKRTVFVLQPGDGDGDALIAKVLKARFFEAVLASEARRERGAEMPLVCYVADEFHRFVTSDETHGEQSFLDRARSFGAGCLLATQSDASVRHALSVAGEPSPGTALRLLLTNSATKLCFRSTEAGVRNLLDGLSPGAGPNRVTVLRPPSSLRPGECYASLPDGRFERRQLKQVDLAREGR